MGCCESTARRASASLPPPPPLPVVSDQIKGALVMEVEEKVKEVLCETPAAPVHHKPPPVKPNAREPPEAGESPPPKTGQRKAAAPAVPTASEKSMSVAEDLKIRGLSERPPNPAGDGGNQRRAERSPVKPRPTRARSLSGELNAVPGRVTGKSPTRIRPDGIGGSVRIVQSRDAGWEQRLDFGERSGRRSGPGSPGKRTGVNGTTRSAADRVPSMRRAELSPGRVKRDPNGSSKRSMNGGDPKQRQSKGGGRESLESPLVSLECFIFL